MPQLRQLEYLVAIADTLHFRRAAEKVHTTQPTLSEQLKALEQRLGAQLVERSRSKVVLTPLGRQIVEIARRMLADANEIYALAASGGRELAGVLRLGLPATIGPYLLPRLIPELHQDYPDLKMYVREELPHDLPRGLEEGQHDVIMTLLPVRGSDIVSVPLFREPLYLAVAADHRLANQAKRMRTDLEGEDVLALGPGHQLHDFVISLCEEFGARLRHDYEGTSLDTLREMVAMGLGITFLPGLYIEAVAARDESLVTCQLDDRAIYRTVGLAWRRSSAREQSYQALCDMTRRLISQEYPKFTVLEDKES